MVNNKFKIFAMNFGSTSTKVAIFEDRDRIFEGKVEHDPAVIKGFPQSLIKEASV